MLTSRDPQVMQKAIKTISRNDRLIEALRKAGAVGAGSQAPTVASSLAPE